MSLPWRDGGESSEHVLDLRSRYRKILFETLALTGDVSRRVFCFRDAAQVSSILRRGRR